MSFRPTRMFCSRSARILPSLFTRRITPSILYTTPSISRYFSIKVEKKLPFKVKETATTLPSKSQEISLPSKVEEATTLPSKSEEISLPSKVEEEETAITPSKIEEITLNPSIPSPRPRTMGEQKHLALPANFHEKLHAPDEFDQWKPEKNEYHIIFIFAFTVVAVVAVDIYWSLYLKPAPLDKLSESSFGSYELLHVIPVTPTTSLFRFKADIPEHKEIPMPSHVVLKDDSCQVGIYP
jgi:hypothetical protein